MWLARRKNVTFRSTPTHASGLHGVAIWFSILAGKSLKGEAFQAVEERRTHAVINYDNETARPFAWTKSKVHQKIHASLINVSGC
jgi:hypothetical protein